MATQAETLRLWRAATRLARELPMGPDQLEAVCLEQELRDAYHRGHDDELALQKARRQLGELLARTVDISPG